MNQITNNKHEPMTTPLMSTRLRAVDLDMLANEVDRLAPPAPAPVEDIGRMSAEAVLRQYEAAAKSVEEMGVEVKNRIAKLEAAMKECDADMKLIAEAAAAIRDKGKLVQAQIEEASALSQEIRAACTDFHKKVGE